MVNLSPISKDSLYDSNDGLVSIKNLLKTPGLAMSSNTCTSNPSLPTSPISQEKINSETPIDIKRKETAERMRKWRAMNKEKNKENDTRCRVYRVAKEKFGVHDSFEKRQFIEMEIKRRNERRKMREFKKNNKLMPSFLSPKDSSNWNLPDLDSILNIDNLKYKGLTLEPKLYSLVDSNLKKVFDGWNFQGAQYVCKKPFI